ncbi:MAG: response regulator [Acidobacteriota bacterium]|nr:response regulator [Acidobacteriota bacterium]
MKPDDNNGIEILIAEDSPTQAEKLQALLEEHGYAVVTAHNGKEALAAARRRKPALILSDVVMPEMDGYALCKAIKSDDGLSDVPLVLLTSLASTEDVVKGLDCGADNFIRKPYDERYLLTRLEAILLGRALRQGQKMQMGVEILLGGRTHLITAERQQILDLLISTYEEAIHINEQLKAVNKELEAFSYSVSHDLRAPLRRIDGFSQALIEEYGGALDDRGRDYLERVRAAAQQMAELIEALLGLSRVARTEMRNEDVDLSALARETADTLRQSQPDRRVDFVIAEGLVAPGDGRLLRVVLENLLGNAWKFTQRRPDARIEFGSARHEGQDAYAVRDNGAGFDMAYAAKLFAPFQRLHAEEEFSGTGIGLATVQRILHRHGGKIWAESEVGKGATFYFTL